MYEGMNQIAAQGACLGQDIKSAYMSLTIGENIDARIASLKVEIERLQGVKSQLSSGTSLLNVRIEDLRQAMNY